MRYLAARALLGIPFRHQGRNPAVGIDCIGLLRLWGDACGLTLSAHDRTNYPRDPYDGMLEQHLEAAFGPPVPLETLRPDDVVAMRWDGGVRHVGIIGRLDDRLSLIHTARNIERVVEHGISPRWQRRFIARVYRPWPESAP